jgi:hypothetical protein
MNRPQRSRWIVVLAATAASACAMPGSGPTPSPVAAQSVDVQQAMVPAGYGTLKFDEITMSMRIDALLVKVTPLDEGVIRLLAPDTYERYHALAERRREEATAATRGVPPEMFLVSFYSYEPDVDYQPEDLQLSHQGRLMRAVKIMPITGSFGRQRLAQQENQSAIYVFDEPINYGLRLVVRYGLKEDASWSSIIQKLEVERSKVRAKAGG